MTDRLAALEAHVAALSAELDAVRALAERNDDWANGTWLALLQLLVQLRTHHPAVLAGLRPEWSRVQRRYQELQSGLPHAEGEEPLDKMEARAKLAYFLWPDAATGPLS